MNTSHLTASERIGRVVEHAIGESKRRNKGPLYHLLARMYELDSDVELYTDFGASSHSGTLNHARGSRTAFGFAVAVLMKYRYRTPGVTQDEIDVAIEELEKDRVFSGVKTENLPVPA